MGGKESKESKNSISTENNDENNRRIDHKQNNETNDESNQPENEQLDKITNNEGDEEGPEAYTILLKRKYSQNHKPSVKSDLTIEPTKPLKHHQYKPLVIHNKPKDPESPREEMRLQSVGNSMLKYRF